MLLDLEEKTRVLVEDIVDVQLLGEELSLSWDCLPVRLLWDYRQALAVKLANEL